MSLDYTDRNGRPLEIGKRIRVQRCVGPYGQTAIVEGVLMFLSIYGGGTLETADGVKYVTFPFSGHEEHVDPEHRHEKWTEIIKE